MIEMLRVDERLIHGQVAVSWTKVLNITHIILINNEVVQNEMQKMTLKMAVPNNVKFLIKDVPSGINLLNDPRTESIRLLVVVSNPSDALEISKNVKAIKLVNLGNYGLFPSKDGHPKTELATCVKVTEDEFQILKSIDALGFKIEAQLTPDANKKNINKILKGD
ncbi:PTS system mannose/fructose/N-acetylgalactosamine-transporter subunit IIB [Fusibacter ferrireducens]|uniref:PTS sugar transporter subunit IIB n=1 Tax=Fusibacter ferrireducens TaxID=2785058 RepID=A0ABR9ZRB7_9FIRM|nr:PTS sugar transporter subunit IIB [Fusibacter ferrireducens]MBF4692521.1 PTS sugar transporter subunit IIB [Fusibacter ferrireducens]